MSGDGREEAREFLAAFLLQMQASERTQQRMSQLLQALVAQNQVLVGQNQTLIGHLGMLSAQLDGMAQRCDLIEQQLGLLSAVLSDGAAPQARALPPGLTPRRVGLGLNGSFGQALGNVVGMGVDQFMQGGGRGGSR